MLQGSSPRNTSPRVGVILPAQQLHDFPAMLTNVQARLKAVEATAGNLKDADFPTILTAVEARLMAVEATAGNLKDADLPAMLTTVQARLVAVETIAGNLKDAVVRLEESVRDLELELSEERKRQAAALDHMEGEKKETQQEDEVRREMEDLKNNVETVTTWR
jgi:hypothetical protein